MLKYRLQIEANNWNTDYRLKRIIQTSRFLAIIKLIVEVLCYKYYQPNSLESVVRFPPNSTFTPIYPFQPFLKCKILFMGLEKVARRTHIILKKKELIPMFGAFVLRLIVRADSFGCSVQGKRLVSTSILCSKKTTSSVCSPCAVLDFVLPLLS